MIPQDNNALLAHCATLWTSLNSLVATTSCGLLSNRALLPRTYFEPHFALFLFFNQFTLLQALLLAVDKRCHARACVQRR